MRDQRATPLEMPEQRAVGCNQEISILSKISKTDELENQIGEGPGEVPQYGNINGVFHLRNRSVRLRRRPGAQMFPGREVQ